MSYFRCHPAAPVEAEMIDYLDESTGNEFAVLADPELIEEARELGLVPSTPEDAAHEEFILSHVFALAP